MKKGKWKHKTLIQKTYEKWRVLGLHTKNIVVSLALDKKENEVGFYLTYKDTENQMLVPIAKLLTGKDIEKTMFINDTTNVIWSMFEDIALLDDRVSMEQFDENHEKVDSFFDMVAPKVDQFLSDELTEVVSTLKTKEKNNE